jgi:hypothetical protein
MKPLPRHLHTPEDKEVEWYREHCYWGFRSADFGHHLAICEESDRRDAELMLRQSWHLPGYAVIEIAHDEGLTTHVIPGRLEREKQQKFRLANPDLFAGIPDKGLL